MYQVLLALNSEEYVLKISEIIQEKFREIQVLDSVYSGDEVLQKIAEEKVDILLISVSLLNINGLDVIKRIREHNRKMRIVIVTAYESAEIINKAIGLGVDWYLLVPIHKVTVIEMISRIMVKIKEEEQEEDRKRIEKNILQEKEELQQYGFIYSLMFNVKYASEIRRYCDLLGFDYNGCILSIEMQFHKESKNFIEKEVVKFLYSVISKYEKCAIGPIISNKIIVFISVDADRRNLKYFEKEMVALAKIIKEKLEEKYQLDLSIGIGNLRMVEDMHASYEESITALSYEHKSSIVLGERRRKRIGEKQYNMLVKQLLEAIKLERTDTLAIVTKLLDYLKTLTPKAKKSKILELLILSNHAIQMEGESEVEFLNYLDLMKEIEESEDIENWAYSKMEYLIRLVRDNETMIKSSTMRDALSYIKLHYTEDISLDMVADYIGISPQHFSKIFKKETGVKYVDWITNHRIEKSKEYIAKGEKTIKEICYLVGYKDPNYFSRIFKKVTGVSPGNYAKGNSNSKN